LDAAEFRSTQASPSDNQKSKSLARHKIRLSKAFNIMFGFRTFFFPSFHAAFVGTYISVLAGEAIFSWVFELSLGQDKKSSLCLSWVVFVAPCIFLVKSFQFATNFCYSTLAPKTMLMVMDILNTST